MANLIAAEKLIRKTVTEPTRIVTLTGTLMKILS